MTPPTNQKVVCKFIGLVNYYNGMWPKCSYVLQNLNKLKAVEVKFKWTDFEQKAFDKIKWIVDRNNLSDYSDFIIKFYTHRCY